VTVECEDKGPDKKGAGRWACHKCQAKNMDEATYCQQCATVRKGVAGLLR
jgi:hypothetical protein